ncbi:MAG: hypothetical protein Q8M74_03960 [Chloroflexota bacterium]|nr:hypothetical protein [Chloroflexota bacterium]
MDVAHPIRAVVPSLDGPVLEVLAGTARPLTTLEIHRLAGVGSSMGVRRVLQRLAAQGIVLADHRGNAIYYVANREHLAWPAVEILTGLRRALREWLVVAINGWQVPPIHASMFGSAARADGDASSDIDILLVRPEPLPGDDERWELQLDAFRSRVAAFTGNRCQTFVVTMERLGEHLRVADPLVDAWLRDGIHLAGDELPAVIASLPAELRS